MIMKILLPTDGSPFAIRAAEFAADLAKRYGAAVTVITVVEMPLRIGLSIDSHEDGDLRKHLEMHAKGILEDTRRVFEQAEVEPKEEIVFGSAVSSILRYAREGSYDLIVIGRRGAGTSAIEQILLGSVAEGILHEATCSVLLVPAK
ncbi:MAG: universal stress protein [Armatimonadota bacterium]|nr:universal stress protein [Armatimonadota bacterium]